MANQKSADSGLNGAEAPLGERRSATEDDKGTGQLEAEQQEQQLQAEEKEHTSFIVGIGASAGGLEALAELVKHVPLDSMAFVVVQHLAPQHESILTHLLSRTSKVDVVTAADGMPVEPNRVYVIPPNADLTIKKGVLHLISPAKAYGPRLAIDFFFRSLAEDQGASAIGIILSGTGTDGTFGMRAIKAAGGITFVQEPSTAKYEGMPRSALASGNADFCLTLEEIGGELTRISQRPRAPAMPRRLAPAPEVQDEIAKLFALVHAQFGNDLSLYKPATVERRIERRMILHKLTRLDEYVRILQSKPEELRALYSDMLITVTNFFRDREPFDALKTKVFSHLLEHKDPNTPIRVWVPACATGEEAYSIAICLLEYVEEKDRGAKVQIFATDIDDEAIQHARRGVYAQNIAPDITPERLNRFFSKKGNEYAISRQIRDMVVFSEQNLLKDAPFSRIDLVSCRNLLIYLKPIAQKRVLRILHYALDPQGFLLLGSSETVSDAPDLFSIVDRRNKLYSKKHIASVAALDVGFAVPGMHETAPLHAGPRPLLSLQALADRKALELYGPPAVILNENMEILHFRGRTGPYLDPAPGAASFNLLRVARPELHMGLKKAIQEALAKQVRVTADSPFRDEGKAGSVRIDVVPMQEPETKIRCLLVMFHKLEPPREVPVVALGEAAGEALVPLTKRIEELEQELVLTKEYLQTTIEEKESANEELKSANEELQSSNEELQSTNEELETSKEEMQSTNEELTTVNEELQNRMEELGVANDDLHNFLAGADNAVLMVGMDQRIRRYTQAAEKLLDLVLADIGRSINFLNHFMGDTDLGKKVGAVTANLITLDEEVLASNQRWYWLRVIPYKTLDHLIGGAIVSFIDIDSRKRAADLVRDVHRYAKFLGVVHQPLAILDAKLRVQWSNEAFHKTFGLGAEEIAGNSFLNIGAHQWADPSLRELLDATAETGRSFRDFKVRHSSRDGGEKALMLAASRIPLLGDVVWILVSIEEAVAPS